MNQFINYERLSDIEKGKLASIVDYEIHGRNQSHHSEFINRLESLGLRKGSQIEVLHNAGNGPIMLRTSGTRIALGRGMGKKIFVKKLESE